MLQAATIFYDNQRYQPTTIEGVVISCTISDSAIYENYVTDYPVEAGYYVQDSIWVRPNVYTITGIVSSIPISTRNYNLPAVTVNDPVTAYDVLLWLRDIKAEITIVASNKIFPNMVFTRFEVYRDKDTGKALSFSADFKQITKVSSQEAIIIGNTSNKGASKTVNKGTKSVEKIDGEKKKSLLHKGAKTNVKWYRDLIGADT